MQTRPARREDREALEQGILEMAQETEGIRLDPQTVRRGVEAILDAAQPGFYRVLEENGRVVAQLMITYEWSDWRARVVWWIQSVYVPPDQRGRGLYARLYRDVLEEARQAGAAGLRLYVDRSNHAAQSVYAALGMDGAHYQVFESMFDEPPREQP
ncbi:MAG: GNAT family N-acetyltransferase [Candidatus Latescibacterota bacterium]|nr:MAG: GNAT family N-acetyltransferase [Candidatus Latescibacterota bacterium]